MKRRNKDTILSKVFFSIALVFCAMLIAIVIFLAAGHGGNDLRPFSEPVRKLTDSADHFSALPAQ